MSGRRGADADAAASATASLEPLDPGEQRRHRWIELGGGRLHQHELELDPSLGAVRGGVERGRDQVEQSHRVGVGQRGGLLGETDVTLRSDLELRRNVAEHLNREQLAAVHLEVPEQLAGIPA